MTYCNRGEIEARRKRLQGDFALQILGLDEALGDIQNLVCLSPNAPADFREYLKKLTVIAREALLAKLIEGRQWTAREALAYLKARVGSDQVAKNAILHLCNERITVVDWSGYVCLVSSKPPVS